MRILLVDDYRPFARSLKSLLSPPHEVELAASAAEALSLIHERPFDAAIVDLRLPDMSGADLCERLRSDAVDRRLGIVLMTGGAADAQLMSRLSSLRVPLVEKPFTTEHLLSVLSPG